MARTSTPTFIVELPLRVPQAATRELLVRLEIARQLYNACLGDALRRLDLLRESAAWAQARALPKTAGKKPNPHRRHAFTAARETHGFTQDTLSAFGTVCKNTAQWNAGRDRRDPRLGAHETQRIAERAFAAVNLYAYSTRGRPRFKGKGRPLHSLEGKSEESGIRWNAGTGCLEWGTLCLRAKLPPDGKDPWLAQALQARTKYARIVWRVIQGTRRWFVQLVQEGLTPVKYKPGPKRRVGLDVGPSTIAVYGKDHAALVPLAPEVIHPWREIRRLQRAMDRSRRATNPECFNADGTFRQGTTIRVRSAGYRALRNQVAETERVLAERRERSHGNLANRILGLGTLIQSETLSYTAFQKCFGRSTKVRGVGDLMSRIRRKAARAGGALCDLNTRVLKLSQYDHLTHTYTKLPLRERWHVLGDGSGVVQRDLYSAFLASVAETDVLHPRRAHMAWPAAQSLLGRAGWRRTQPVSVASVLVTAPGLPTPERVARQRVLARGKPS
jgi:hypothetical protein